MQTTGQGTCPRSSSGSVLEPKRGPGPLPTEVQEQRSWSKFQGHNLSIPKESQGRESLQAQLAQKVFKAFPNLIYVKKSLESHSPLISCQQRSEGGEGRTEKTNSFPRARFQGFKNAFSRASHVGGAPEKMTNASHPQAFQTGTTVPLI